MSRLKKIAMGCGSVIALFVFIGVIISLAIVLDRPEPADVSDISLNESLGGQSLEGGNTIGNGKNTGKALKVKLDIQYARFKLKRGDQLGSVVVNGTYDQANFDLKTEAKEKDNQIIYDISFENKRNALAMIWETVAADHRNDEDSFLHKNELEILLPADMPIDLVLDLGIGKNDMDLTGLAINSITGEVSKGGIDVVMKEPNPIPMQEMRFEGQTGNFNWYDVQNYNFKEGTFHGNMGQLEVIASGPFKQDTLLNVDHEIGELKIINGADTNLDNQVKASLADKSRGIPTEHDPNLPTLTIKGKFALGDMRIYNHDDPRHRLNEVWRRSFSEDAPVLIAELRAIHQKNNKVLRPSNINSLGYSALRHDNPAKAIEIFKLNVELHPDYANGYDSLGEAYYKNDQPEEALKNYQKALEMEPHSDNAQRWVERIQNELGNTAPATPADEAAETSKDQSSDGSKASL